LNPEIRATILRALSLLAAVESSGDELIGELWDGECAEFAFRGHVPCTENAPLECRCNVGHLAAARILALTQEKAAQGEWEERAVRSMNAASEAIGVLCCDLVPAAVVALKGELASVKAHADAMAEALDYGENFGAYSDLTDAYRAAHPKEGA